MNPFNKLNILNRYLSTVDLAASNQVQAIIKEANARKKKKILIDKIGFSEDTADWFIEKAGAFAVWVSNKILEDFVSSLNDDNQSVSSKIDKSGAARMISPSVLTHRYGQDLTSVMDWIHVGLNNSHRTIKELTWMNLVIHSDDWHESLEAGEGKIDYQEDNLIVVDFRDSNGLGYYWANLQTNKDKEEAELMGHCASTQRGNTLFSLRSYKDMGNGHTINSSHLTASIDVNWGSVAQLKGPKNTKPKEEYHPYIIELLNWKDFDEYEDESKAQPYIRGFTSEYESHLDFKLSDLSKENVIKVYESNPGLFNNISGKILLDDKQILPLDPKELKFEWVLDFDYVEDFVDGNYRTALGSQNNSLFNKILSEDCFEIYDSFDNFDQWESILEYHVSDRNKEAIKKIIEIMAIDKDIDITNRDFVTAIKIVDSDFRIGSTVSQTYSSEQNQAAQNDMSKALYDTIANAYGTVLKTDYQNTNLIIDLDLNYYRKEDSDLFIECLDEVSNGNNDTISDGNIQELVEMLVEREVIDKPMFKFDDRYEPYIDDDSYNNYLSDTLGDLLHDLSFEISKKEKVVAPETPVVTPESSQ